MSAFPIVDSHVHLWDPKQLNYAWLRDLPTLNRALLPGDFNAASAPASLQKFVVVECGCDAAKNAAEVDWISSLAKNEPRLKGIVAHAPLERGDDVQSELESLAKRPLVRGVRRNLQDENNEFLRQPALVKGLRALSGFDFTFDLCVRAGQLPLATGLVLQAPEVIFVLDHLGKPAVREKGFEPWARHLQSLAALPNVVCKLSGLATEANWRDWKPAGLAPYIEHALECFGPGRLLFGSDWPVITLAATYHTWLETVSNSLSRLSSLERNQIYQTNAERIYRV